MSHYPHADFTYRSALDGSGRYEPLYRLHAGPWMRCYDAADAFAFSDTPEGAELIAARSLLAAVRQEQEKHGPLFAGGHVTQPTVTP